MRPRLLVTAVVLLVSLAGDASGRGREELILFASNRTPLFADRIYAFAPDAPAGKRLRVLGEGAHPVWSPDGRRIAFLRPGSGLGRDLYVMNADGTGVRLVVSDPQLGDFSPISWSPDGGKLTYHRYGPDLVIHDLATGTQSTIRGALDVSWSPDGERVAYSDYSRYPYGLETARSDGSDERELATFVTGGSPAWSPDGRRIAYVRNDERAQVDLYVIGADGLGERRLTADQWSEHAPSWSPDGRLIAFVRLDRGVGGIHVMRSDGTDVRRLTTDRTDSSPTFSPDGRQIAFVRRGRIWAMRADGTRERRLSGQLVFPRGLSWSPDGSALVFSRGAIFVVRAGGTAPRRLTSDAYDIHPAWAPDGRRIAFMRDEERRNPNVPNVAGLYVMSADGTDVHRVLGGPAYMPSWSRDGRRLVFQRFGRLFVADESGGGLRELEQVAPLGWTRDPSWRP